MASEFLNVTFYEKDGKEYYKCTNGAEGMVDEAILKQHPKAYERYKSGEQDKKAAKEVVAVEEVKEAPAEKVKEKKVKEKK